eukprot:GHVU01091849.1.p1 GENE.GHVU01091849.1~~GHVU01091849.1.p1  ORF type:complete len:1811 (+),score=260.22 GHVU01091849.1:3097-8529(+)
MGYLFMAIAGDKCYCGDSFTADGTQPDGCNQCADANIECGDAAKTMSVYKFSMDVRREGAGRYGLVERPALVKVTTTVGEVYVGCYKDAAARALPHLMSDNVVNHHDCIAKCSEAGHPYAGVADQRHCYCGTNFERYGEAEEDTCDKPCGNGFPCGGHWRISVYSVPQPSRSLRHYSYLGCYTLGEKHSLNGLTFNTTGDSLHCLNDCRRRGYHYAGLKKTGTDVLCSCGDDYGAYGAGGDSQCTRDGATTLFVGNDGGGAESTYYLWATHTGCFEMPTSQAALSRVIYQGDARMTVHKCVNGCAKQGYPYSSIASGNECRCGYYSYDSSPPVPQERCDTACTGKSGTKVCGGGATGKKYHDVFLTRTERTVASYVGCIRDDKDRDLPVAVEHAPMARNVPNCNFYCQSMGYAYAGSQNGGQCYCGNAYSSEARYSKADPSHCRANCSLANEFGGDAKCGGNLHSSVYSVQERVYFGAYKHDYWGSRALSYCMGDMPLDECIEKCSEDGYKFAGMQEEKCFCDNQVGTQAAPQLELDEEKLRSPQPVPRSYRAGSTENKVVSVYEAQEFEYIGCFKSNNTDPHMSTIVREVSTPRECYVHCRAHMFKFFGLQGRVCYCDVTFGKYPRVSVSECGDKAGDGGSPSGPEGDPAVAIYDTLGPEMVGMYQLKEGARVATNQILLDVSPTMCEAECRRAGQMIAALQGGSKCLCGPASVLGTRVADRGDIPCNKDNEFECASGHNIVAFTAADHASVGCYEDDGSALPIIIDNNANGHGDCLHQCGLLGFRYAGHESGMKCFCGDHLPAQDKKKTVRECNAPCRGQLSQRYCGSVGRVEVFDVASKHVGCFEMNDDAFKHLVLNSADRTNYLSCSIACRDTGFLFTAISSHGCYCGHTFQASKAGGARCLKCEDSSHGCGGDANSMLFSVYKATRGVSFSGLSVTNAAHPGNYHSTRGKVFGSMPLSGLEYVGCFKESALRYKQANQATLTDCARTCTKHRFAFFGVKKDECYCDHYYSREENAKVDRTVCPYTCRGTLAAECGGSGHVSVYTTRQHETDRPLVSYMGCYNSRTSSLQPYDLDHVGPQADTGFVPVAMGCWEYCAEKSFEFAGVNKGTGCFCGHSYGRFGPAADAAACEEHKDARDNKTPMGGENVTAVYYTHASYEGCFADESGHHVSHQPTRGNPDVQMTIPKCVNYCKLRGYGYAALQGGHHCQCGHTTPLSIVSDKCTTPCGGSTRQTCGGTRANSIYKLASSMYEGRHIGCFKDNWKKDMRMSYSTDKVKNPNVCTTQCQGYGYRYAALTNGGYCSCSDAYLSASEVQEATLQECNIPCPSGAGRCGGVEYNSVFALRDVNNVGVHRGVDASQPSHELQSVERCIETCTRQGSMFAAMGAGKCVCTGPSELGPFSPGDDTQPQPQSGGGDGSLRAGGINGIVSVYQARESSYMGCFRLTDNARFKPAPMGVIGASEGLWRCSMECSRYGFKFFGVETQGDAHQQCYCADAFGRQAALPDSNCTGRKKVKVYNAMHGLEYVGCFKGTGQRGELNSLEAPGHSPLTCAHHCGALGYAYSGVTRGDVCRCGNEYKSGGPGACEQQCNLDEHRACGSLNEFATFKALSHPAVGCFEGAAGPGETPYKPDDSAVDSGRCTVHCRRRGFNYALLENSRLCYCRSDLPPTTRRPLAECGNANSCVRDLAAETGCGAADRTIVFDLGATEVGCYRYDGVFQGRSSKMVLQAARETSSTGTIYNHCQYTCRAQGKSIMAIAGDKCYCGQSFRASSSSPGNCTQCSDANTECGDKDKEAVSLYTFHRGE